MTRVTQRMLDAYNVFRAAGMHEEGASAPPGNFVQESGENLDSTMYRLHPDASGGVREDLKSGGIAEWLGSRKLDCIDFSRDKARRLGLPAGPNGHSDQLLNDLKTQCEFVVFELKNGEKKSDGGRDHRYDELWRQLTTKTDDRFGRPRSVANLTANFMKLYERPAYDPDINKLNRRIEYAEALFDRVQLIKAAQDGQPLPPPVPPPPIPSVPIPPIPTVPAGPPPISAGTAGRQAAVQHALDSIGINYIVELEAYRREMNAKIDATIANFKKLEPDISYSAPLALPSPTAIIDSTTPTALASQTGKLSMSNITPQLLATLRSVLLGAGGYFVGKGIVDEQTMTTVVGGAMYVIPFAWSLWSHRPTGIIAAAAALPDVKAIVTTPEIADSPTFAKNQTVVRG